MEISIKQIGNKGEIVIPKRMRERNGMHVNTKVEIIGIKDGVLIVSLKKKLGDLAGMFGNKGIKEIGELDAVAHEFLAGMIE